MLPDLTRLSLVDDCVEDTEGKSGPGPSKTIKKKPKPKPKPVLYAPTDPADIAKLLGVPYPAANLQDHLNIHGYVVFPTRLADDAERALARQDYWRIMDESPEFVKPPDGSSFAAHPDWRPVLGGFAALGNPSSFHHEVVRNFREFMLYEVLEKDVLPAGGRKIEKCFDRIVLRRTGQTPTGESWHRDEAQFAMPGDDVFGGWLNINDRNQVFHCVPATHREVGGQNKGFAKLETAAEKAHYAPRRQVIQIPPGHMLCFYERLMHEVAPNMANDDTLRFHCGFRVTSHDEPLFGRRLTTEWLRDQAVCKIKSGQNPEVFPTAYTNFPGSVTYHDGVAWQHAAELPVWSKAVFNDICLEDKTIKVSETSLPIHRAWDGAKVRRVPARMRSLRYYGERAGNVAAWMHRDYEQHEFDICFPQASWPSLWTGRRLESGALEKKSMALPSRPEMAMYAWTKMNLGPDQQARRPVPWSPDDNDVPLTGPTEGWGVMDEAEA